MVASEPLATSTPDFSHLHWQGGCPELLMTAALQGRPGTWHGSACPSGSAGSSQKGRGGQCSQPGEAVAAPRSCASAGGLAVSGTI